MEKNIFVSKGVTETRCERQSTHCLDVNQLAARRHNSPFAFLCISDGNCYEYSLYTRKYHSLNRIERVYGLF